MIQRPLAVPLALVLFLGLTFTFTALAQTRSVSLDYTNADLVPVLKRLAKDAGMNIFVSPEVKGSVTLRVGNVSPTSALELILSLQEQEYRYKILKNTLVVATPEKLQKIPDDLFGP